MKATTSTLKSASLAAAAILAGCGSNPSGQFAFDPSAPATVQGQPFYVYTVNDVSETSKFEICSAQSLVPGGARDKIIVGSFEGNLPTPKRIVEPTNGCEEFKFEGASSIYWTPVALKAGAEGKWTCLENCRENEVPVLKYQPIKRTNAPADGGAAIQQNIVNFGCSIRNSGLASAIGIQGC